MKIIEWCESINEQHSALWVMVENLLEVDLLAACRESITVYDILMDRAQQSQTIPIV